MIDRLGLSELEEEDLYPFDDDIQGRLVFEANRIANGDSAESPTVEMLQALFTELGIARTLACRLHDYNYDPDFDDIPF